MLISNIHDAKSNLSSLTANVLDGKDEHISKKKQRIPGLFKGQTWIADDFVDDKLINQYFKRNI